MPTNIKTLLARQARHEPSAQMLDMIMCDIGQEKALRNLKYKIYSFSLGTMALVGVMGAYWKIFWLELAQSSFMAYLQTALADREVLMVYWKEFLLSLVESLPITNLIVWSLLAFCVIGLVAELTQWIRWQPHNHRRLTSS
jgi:hypothetical protein